MNTPEKLPIINCVVSNIQPALPASRKYPGLKTANIPSSQNLYYQ